MSQKTCRLGHTYEAGEGCRACRRSKERSRRALTAKSDTKPQVRGGAKRGVAIPGPSAGSGPENGVQREGDRPSREVLVARAKADKRFMWKDRDNNRVWTQDYVIGVQRSERTCTACGVEFYSERDLCDHLGPIKRALFSVGCGGWR